MDGPTEGRTDRPFYRDAWTHLKSESNCLPSLTTNCCLPFCKSESSSLPFHKLRTVYFSAKVRTVAYLSTNYGHLLTFAQTTNSCSPFCKSESSGFRLEHLKGCQYGEISDVGHDVDESNKRHRDEYGKG